jgi:hypothetical protein
LHEDLGKTRRRNPTNTRGIDPSSERAILTLIACARATVADANGSATDDFSDELDGAIHTTKRRDVKDIRPHFQARLARANLGLETSSPRSRDFRNCTHISEIVLTTISQQGQRTVRPCRLFLITGWSDELSTYFSVVFGQSM